MPGLNAAIKALVYRAEEMAVTIVGIRKGWEGITYLDRSRGRDGLIFRRASRAHGKGATWFP